MSLVTEIQRLETAKADIKTAINAKGGTLTTELLSDYADAIDALSTSGSAPVKKDVNFYDYNGTLVAGYTVAEAQALGALPSVPDHSGDTVPLTSQGWNYTLSQVNATTDPLDVGAMYTTADGKSKLHIRLTTVSGLEPTIYLNKSDGSTLLIEWGDTNTDTSTDSGDIDATHTYASAGDYTISLSISSGSGTYALGGSAPTVGGWDVSYASTLLEVNIGDDVTGISDSGFGTHLSLSSISISSGIASIGTYAFDSCPSLSSLTFPLNMTGVSDGVLNGCKFAEYVSIPASVTSIGEWAFNSCYGLRSLLIPSGVTSIGAAAISGCTSLASVSIPSGVTTLEDEVLAYNPKVLKLIFTTNTPPTMVYTSAFNDIVSICKIYVPDAYVSTYQAATNWSTYADYIYPLSEL